MYCGTVPHAYCSLYSISLLHRLFDLYCCYNPFPFLYIVFDQLTTKAVALLLILGQFLPSSSLILLPLLLCRHQLPLWPWLRHRHRGRWRTPRPRHRHCGRGVATATLAKPKWRWRGRGVRHRPRWLQPRDGCETAVKKRIWDCKVPVQKRRLNSKIRAIWLELNSIGSNPYVRSTVTSVYSLIS